MARFVGMVTLAGCQIHCPRIVRLVQSNFSCVCMYTTRVHILYAGAMIERPLGKRVWLPLRNREAKLFSRLLPGLHFHREGFRFGINVRSLIDAIVISRSHIRIKHEIKSGNLLPQPFFYCGKTSCLSF